jgi:Glycoside hydrolase 123 N-terminal domain
MLKQLRTLHWVLLALLLVAVAAAVERRALRHIVRRAWRARPVGAQWITFEETRPKPSATAGQLRDGFIVFQRSTLERIHPNSHPLPAEVVSSVTLHATWDEWEPVQLAVYPLRDLKHMQVTVSGLSDGQHVIPASELTVRMVRYYGAPLSVRVANRFGVVPKTLEVAAAIDLGAEAVRPYWITVHVPDNRPGGQYTGTIIFAHAGGEKTIPLTVDVIPVKLQEPDILYGTLCMNVLANVGKVRGGGRLLRQTDLVFRDLRAHGMNLISLRSGHTYEEDNDVPFLPDLEVAMDLYKKYGFPQPLIYCPGQLFKTDKINRSNNYREFDPNVQGPIVRKVAAYYSQEFKKEGLPGVMFIPVEEPNVKSGVGRGDPPDIRQRLSRELTRTVKEAGGTVALTCTPESVQAAIDYVDYWIVAFKRFTPAVYDMARKAHAQLCLYANGTVMGQGTYFSRFMFGYFVWANGIKGMLPWTYPLTPKRFPHNVGNRGEGPLNVHDGFLGPDGRPVPTIQWELSREGIDDAKYMVTIERLAHQARAGGTPDGLHAAEEADRFLADIKRSVKRDPRHYIFEDPRTFEPTPVDDWNAAKFEATHERAVTILKQLVALQQEAR